MVCLKCKEKATEIIKVNVMNINEVYSCNKCLSEIKRDFNMAVIHDDSGDTLFINNILKKYSL